jgi:Flp pilus assembly protein TadD/dienelactone hydrolase
VGIQEILKGEHQYIRVDREYGSDTVLIIFSHIGYPAGKFAMSNALANISATKIFINCRDSAWYQQGIEGVSSSIDETVVVLTELLEKIAPARVFTTGMSMGGYAALLFGLKLKCDAVLAFTAEVAVGAEHLRSFTLNKRKVYDYKYRSLANLVWQNSSTKIFGIYGAYDLVDLALLSTIAPAIEKRELFTLHLVSGGHQVTHRLDIPSIVGKLFEEGAIDSSDVHKSYTLPSAVTVDELALYAEIQRCRVINDKAATYKLLKGSELTMTRTNLMLWLGNACIDLRYFEEAERVLLDAIRMDPHGHELYHALGITYFASGDFAKAVPAFTEAIRLDPSAMMSHYRVAYSFEKLGNIEQAKAAYANGLKINPNHSESKERLRVLEAA